MPKSFLAIMYFSKTTLTSSFKISAKASIFFKELGRL